MRGITNFELDVGPPTGWRTRAKLPVRGTFLTPQIGLYKEGSHQVVEIPHCLIHHPSINLGIEQLRTYIRKEQIIPYNETTHAGDLRYLQLAVERKTGTIQLGLVFNAENMQDSRVFKWQTFLDKLWKDRKLWHSIWVNFNTRRDNVIFGPLWLPLFGEQLLWETVAGVDVCFLPSTFAQANLDLFEEMILTIRGWVPPQSTVTEYYAGVGVLGLSIAEKCRWVRCCEVNVNAKYCFEQASTRLSPEVRHKVSFYEGAAGKQIDLMQDAEGVIVDPPRKGLDFSLLKALCDPSSLKRIVYVSCGWSAFQRDCDALLAKGWSLKEARGFLFFPGTNHIETAALFCR